MRYQACAIGQKTEGSITQERLAILRTAIRNRSLSFPAQVPAFAHEQRRDVQWRVVSLYFVRGWSCRQLASRYALTPGRIRQLIREWVERAVALGYLQAIPPEIDSAVPGTLTAPARPAVYSDVVLFPPVTVSPADPLRLTARARTATHSFGD